MFCEKSNYTDTYPEKFDPWQNAYNRQHCLSLWCLKQKKDKCQKDLGMFLDDLVSSQNNRGSTLGSGESCGWRSRGFDKSQFHRIYCKSCAFPNEFNKELEDGMKVCLENAVDISYGFHEKIEKRFFSTKYRTQISLKRRPMKIVTTTQYPALDLSEFFAQIGGFLGLLVGASAITMIEFFEFSILSVIPCFHSLLHKEK